MAQRNATDPSEANEQTNSEPKVKEFSSGVS